MAVQPLDQVVDSWLHSYNPPQTDIGTRTYPSVQSVVDEAMQPYRHGAPVSREDRVQREDFPISWWGIGHFLDLISRPGSAIANLADDVIGTLQFGEEFHGVGRSLWEGLSAQRRTYWSDITHGFMSEDTPGWFKSLAGFAGDVFLDPITYVSFGTLTKAGRLAKRAGVAPEATYQKMKAGKHLPTEEVARFPGFKNTIKGVDNLTTANIARKQWKLGETTVSEVVKPMAEVAGAVVREMGVPRTSKLAKEVTGFLTDPKVWDIFGTPADAFYALRYSSDRATRFLRGQQGMVNIMGKKVEMLRPFERLLVGSPGVRRPLLGSASDVLRKQPVFRKVSEAMAKGFDTAAHVPEPLKPMFARGQLMKNARMSIQMNAPRQFRKWETTIQKEISKKFPKADIRAPEILGDFLETPTFAFFKHSDVGKSPTLSKVLRPAYDEGDNLIKAGLDSFRKVKENVRMIEEANVNIVYENFPSRLAPGAKVSKKIVKKGREVTVRKPRTLLDDYLDLIKDEKIGETVKEYMERFRDLNRRMLEFEKKAGISVEALGDEFLEYVPSTLSRSARNVMQKHNVFEELYLHEVADLVAHTTHRSQKPRGWRYMIEDHRHRRIRHINEVATGKTKGDLSELFNVRKMKGRSPKDPTKLEEYASDSVKRLEQAFSEIQGRKIPLYEDSPAVAIGYRIMRHETTMQGVKQLDEIKKLYGLASSEWPVARKIIGSGKESRAQFTARMPDWAGAEKATFTSLPPSVHGKFPAMKEFAFPKEITDYLVSMTKKLDPKDTPNFLKYYDKYYNIWKQWLLFPIPGFHTRNVVDNCWKMYLHGVDFESFQDVVGMYDMFKTGKYIKKTTGRGRVFDGHKLRDAVEELGIVGSGFSAQVMNPSLENMIDTPAKLTGAMAEAAKRGKLVEFGGQLGTSVEDFFRTVVFWDGLKKGETIQRASESVGKVLFNYGDLTRFEKTYLKRLIPFYSFMRKNTPFHLEKLFTEPGKIRRLEKGKVAFEALTEHQPEEGLPDWLSGPLTVRTPFRDDDGNPKYANLEYWLSTMNLVGLTSPQEMFPTIFNMMTPAIKTPLSVIANYDPFTQSPIQQEPGETRELLGIDMPVKIEHALRSAAPGGRLAYETTRLNPLNIFGQKEHLPPGLERAVGFATGARTYSVDPQTLQTRTVENQQTQNRIDELNELIREALTRGDHTKANELRKELGALLN